MHLGRNSRGRSGTYFLINQDQCGRCVSSPATLSRQLHMSLISITTRMHGQFDPLCLLQCVRLAFKTGRIPCWQQQYYRDYVLAATLAVLEAKHSPRIRWFAELGEA